MSTAAKILNAADEISITTAVNILREGGIVAFPTETVYGLGADAFNPEAVARVFEVKKRPFFDPLIVHVASFEEALSLWDGVPDKAEILMKNFWPGPLTLVFNKTPQVPDIVTAGLPSVAVRMPQNPEALTLIRRLGRPIAAPSANTFGYTSATTAQAVADDFGDTVDLILDGGPTKVGVESTVLKLEKDGCVLLRPGGVPVEDIRKFVNVIIPEKKKDAPLESPGQIESHYAPWTPFVLQEEIFPEFLKNVQSFYTLFQEKGVPWPRLGLILLGEKKISQQFFESIEILSPSGDLREAAANLFQVIRKLDKMHLDLIVAEKIDPTGLGLAILDRLKKASANTVPIKHFFENRLQ